MSVEQTYGWGNLLDFLVEMGILRVSLIGTPIINQQRPQASALMKLLYAANSECPFDIRQTGTLVTLCKSLVLACHEAFTPDIGGTTVETETKPGE